jgi:hypothetical protein
MRKQFWNGKAREQIIKNSNTYTSHHPYANKRHSVHSCEAGQRLEVVKGQDGGDLQCVSRDIISK